jgi:hypothetical protein
LHQPDWYGIAGTTQSLATVERLHIFLKIAVKGAGQIVVIKTGYSV